MQPITTVPLSVAQARSRRDRVTGAARRFGLRLAPELARRAINEVGLRWARDVRGVRFIERPVLDYRLLLDLHDTGISRQLMIANSREEEHVHILNEELRPGMHVFDLGANIGYYSVMMARKVGPTGRVYAAEPSPSNYQLLMLNLRRNEVDGIVEAQNVGIGRESGRARFFLSSRCNCHTFCPEGIADEIGTDFADAKSLQLPIIAVAEFLSGKPPIDLLRMDIEGYEVEVLEGLLPLVRAGKAPARLLFETHPLTYGSRRDRVRAVIDALFRNGYAARWVAADYYVERDGRAAFAGLGYGDSSVAATFPSCDRALFRGIGAEHAAQMIVESDFVRAVMLAKL